MQKLVIRYVLKSSAIASAIATAAESLDLISIWFGVNFK
jgi:hypothetical protein